MVALRHTWRIGLKQSIELSVDHHLITKIVLVGSRADPMNLFALSVRSAAFWE